MIESVIYDPQYVFSLALLVRRTNRRILPFRRFFDNKSFHKLRHSAFALAS